MKVSFFERSGQYRNSAIGEALIPKAEFRESLADRNVDFLHETFRFIIRQSTGEEVSAAEISNATLYGAYPDIKERYRIPWSLDQIHALNISLFVANDFIAMRERLGEPLLYKMGDNLSRDLQKVAIDIHEQYLPVTERLEWIELPDQMRFSLGDGDFGSSFMVGISNSQKSETSQEALAVRGLPRLQRAAEVADAMREKARENNTNQAESLLGRAVTWWRKLLGGAPQLQAPSELDTGLRPELVEAMRTDAESFIHDKIVSLYVPLEHEDGVPQTFRKEFGDKKCKWLEEKFGAGIGSAAQIAYFSFTLKKGEKISEAIERFIRERDAVAVLSKTEAPQRKPPVLSEDLVRFFLNCFLYIHSGEPDMSLYKPPKLGRGLRDARRKIARKKNATSNIPMILVGFNHAVAYEKASDGSLVAVRGHWRWQPYGPQWSLIKLIFIHAYLRNK